MKKIHLKKRWYFVIAIIIFLLYRLVVGFFTTKPTEEAVVELRDLIQETRVVGDIVAHDEAFLGFGTTGRIETINFEVGDFVAEDDVLATIDTQSASAEYSLAQANFEREQAGLRDLLDGNRLEEINIEEDNLVIQDESVQKQYQTLYQELARAITVSEDAIRLKTDRVFREPAGYAKLDFSTDGDLRKILEEERRDFDLLFKLWNREVAEFSSENYDPAIFLEVTMPRIRRVQVFLGNLTQALASARSDESNEDMLEQFKTSTSAARTAVEVQISLLESVYADYQRAVAERNKQLSQLALVKAGATSGQISTQQARVQAERARVEQASSSIFDTKVVAPFAGIVTEQVYEEGETVNTGIGVIRIATLDNLEVESFIPEVFIGSVTLGDKALISLDAYPNRSLDAEVVSVDPGQTDRDGLATYKTILKLEKDEDVVLRLGMTADITIITSEKKGVAAVPLEYVIFENNQAFLLKKNGEESSEKVPVILGIIDPNGVQEIISGLSVGDIVKKYE